MASSWPMIRRTVSVSAAAVGAGVGAAVVVGPPRNRWKFIGRSMAGVPGSGRKARPSLAGVPSGGEGGGVALDGDLDERAVGLHRLGVAVPDPGDPLDDRAALLGIGDDPRDGGQVGDD